MSMVTAMDGIGDVNHVDTVHDNVSEEYKQAMEKAKTNYEKSEYLQKHYESFEDYCDQNDIEFDFLYDWNEDSIEVEHAEKDVNGVKVHALSVYGYES